MTSRRFQLVVSAAFLLIIIQTATIPAYASLDIFTPTLATDSSGNDVTHAIATDDGYIVKIKGGDNGQPGEYIAVSAWDRSLPPGAGEISAVAKVNLLSCTQDFNLDFSLRTAGLDVAHMDPSTKGAPGVYSCDLTYHGVDTVEEINSLELTITGYEVPDSRRPDMGEVDSIWLEVTYAENWGLADWAYRVPITVENKVQDDLVDYQVSITLDTQTLISSGKMRSDGGDIRFLYEDGVTELDHWVESGLGETDTRIWIEIPNIPGSGTRTIWLYYGNPNAEPKGNATDTFDFYSSFETETVLSIGEGFERYAGNPLDIPRYDANGMVHPDVLYFPDGNDGYEFWMYYTPYPPDECEVPCLVRSNDGYTFADTGISNPLITVGSSEEWDNGLLADPDVVVVDGTWYMYYTGRAADKSYQRIGLATSSDGKNFEKAEGPILSADTGTSHEAHDYLLSPTVYHNETGFYMWYFSEGSDSRYRMCLATSDDGIQWAKYPGNPIMEPMPSSFERNGIWHGDVIHLQNQLWLYYVGYDGDFYQLCLARSDDGIGWERSTMNPVLDPIPLSWEDRHVYRSSPVIVGDEMWLYYSAYDASFTPQIGLAKSWEGITCVTPDLSQWSLEGYVHGSREHARDSEYGLREVGGSTYPKAVREFAQGFHDYTTWIYDDMTTEAENLAILRLIDTSSAFIGLGIYTGHSTTNYVYHTYPLAYHTTDLPRSRGWHRLSIRTESSISRLYIDGQQVAELDPLDEANLAGFSLEGYLGGAGWFDDVRVRKHASSEPQVSMGEEEEKPVPDTTPPVITSVQVVDITSTSATITWNTDEPSDSTVDYGPTADLGVTEADSTLVTEHAIVLTGLTADTLYYFDVASTDASGNTATEDNGGNHFTFTTGSSGNILHVAAIEMTLGSKNAGPNEFVGAIAAVTVFDDSGAAVEGATVTGHWEGATTDSDTATTSGSGDAAMESDSVKNPPSGTTFTFVIDDVSKDGWIYDASISETRDSISTP